MNKTRIFAPNSSQVARILKSREGFQFKLWTNKWRLRPTKDWQFRLVALQTIKPNETIRQTINRTKLNIREN